MIRATIRQCGGRLCQRLRSLAALECRLESLSGGNLWQDGRIAHGYGLVERQERRYSGPSAVVENLSQRRSVLLLTGVDRYSFLQGLVTNDIEELQSDPSVARCMYSLLLNHKGRFMHDMFVYNVGDAETSGNGSLLIDLHKPSLSSVVKVLKRYKLRSRVEIEDVSEKYSVLYSSHDSGDVLSSVASSHPCHTFKDPRHAALGYRCLLERSPTSLSQDKDLDESTRAHVGLRYALGIPEGDLEIPSGRAIPLEFNTDALHGISYTKGCYMGQELTARTHFQGLVRKRLLPVTVSAVGGELAAISRALEKARIQDADGGGDAVDVVDPERNARKGGKKVGSLLALQGGQGLALLRLKGLMGKTVGLRVKSVSGDVTTFQAKVEASIPDWWPQEWYQSAQET